MKLQVKTHGYRMTKQDKDKLDETAEHLDRLTDTYEMRHLHVTVDKVGHSDYVDVKMVLALARRRLVVEESGPTFSAAAQTCVDVLSRKIKQAKDRTRRGHGRRTLRKSKAEAALVDVSSLRKAIVDRDYESFRDALREAPGSIESELARRLKRHPRVEAVLGERVLIADLVEGVIRHAYESFSDRPASTPIHDWIFKSIDPVMEDVAARA